MLVALGAAAPFLPALGNGFVWDDVLNFVDNPAYRGLGRAQLAWMLTTTHMGHWVPLTWATLGADYLWWGLDPCGYHLGNVVLHAATAVAVYLVSSRLLGMAGAPGAAGAGTGQRVGAAVAALLFAVHPLRVESVAWATERRDVLSGLFFVLAVACHLRRFERDPARPVRPWYWLSFACFVLAVLSKAITVTLPAVLLVLDVYPLGRLRRRPGAPGPVRRALALLAEKLPFVAVALAAGSMAILAAARGGELRGVSEVDVLDRGAIALHAVAFYLWKTAVPVALAPLYELPTRLEGLRPPAAASGLVVLALTALAVLARRRLPALGAAWIAYLVLVLPVSGLLQNGFQSAADRYTYLPSLPWAVLAGAGLDTAWRRWPGWPRRALLAAALVASVSLAAMTARQVAVWRSPESLWRHALATTESSIAHYNLGVVLTDRGQPADAIPHYRRALAIRPSYFKAQANLGLVLARTGRWDEAIEAYGRALELDPSGVEVRLNLGTALVRQGRFDEAIAQYREALRLKPGDPVAHYNWGNALARQERWDAAIEAYRAALGIDPRFAEARSNLGVALSQLGRLDEAIEEFHEALRSKPDYAPARRNLDLALARQRAARR